MESLLQKVNNITEELKAKDILLARTEVQAKEPENLAEQLSQDLSKQPPALAQDTYPHSDNSGHLQPPNSPLFCTSPTPFSGLSMYEDEDVYMGDNEADKLREKKRFKKGLRKGEVQQDGGMSEDDAESESSKRAKRKGKGKARQESESYDRQKMKGKARQVEDEEVENNSDKAREDVENEGIIDIESDNGALESGIDINFDGDEEVIEMEAEAVRLLLTRSKLLLSLSKGPSARPSSVPPHYKFSRPKGGAGPRLRAQATPTRMPSDTEGDSEFDGPPDSGSESNDPPQTLNTIPNPLNLPHDALVALTRTVLGVIGHKDDLLANRVRRRRITSQKIKQPTVRASKTRRKRLGVMDFIDQKHW